MLVVIALGPNALLRHRLAGQRGTRVHVRTRAEA
jgi:hypothetical protein